MKETVGAPPHKYGRKCGDEDAQQKESEGKLEVKHKKTRVGKKHVWLPPAEKLRLVKEIENVSKGERREKVLKIAEETGLHPQTVHSWRRKAGKLEEQAAKYRYVS